ncbi:MAG TPA: hypothetical protein PKC91_12815 [Ignavibacteria bacterium]|nr:hypothetical protein [Ignavibacteria bacterium]
MKNLTSILTLTIAFTSVLLSIPAVRYISGIAFVKSKERESRINAPVKFDDSLRNFHPNKGE